VPRMCRIMKPWSLCQQESRKFVMLCLRRSAKPAVLYVCVRTQWLHRIRWAALAQASAQCCTRWREQMPAAADTLKERALHCRYKWASQEMAHAQGPDLSRVSQKGLTHRQEQVCPYFLLQPLRHSVHVPKTDSGPWRLPYWIVPVCTYVNLVRKGLL